MLAGCIPSMHTAYLWRTHGFIVRDVAPHAYARIACGMGTLKAFAAATTYGASTAHFDPPDGMKKLSRPEYQ